MAIDTVHSTGVGGNRYEYFLNLRNASRSSLTADVSLSGFPCTVTLFSPALPGVPLGAHAPGRR